MESYDFSGWATRYNVKCSDGRTIMKDAFKHQDGAQVPLVWNHNHDTPENVLGKAFLEHRDEGVYAYCVFNDNESGQTAKELVKHGDVESLSIWAGHLKQHGPKTDRYVEHGKLTEVSLVLAGANPEAFIESVMIHGEESEEDAVIYTGEQIELYHSDESKEKETGEVEDETKKTSDDDKTVEEVFNEMTPEQQNVTYAMIGAALEAAGVELDDEDDDGDDAKHSDESEDNNDNNQEGDDVMKHNIFDKETEKKDNVLSHSDQESIIALAKSSSVGSFQEAFAIFAEENEMQHADAASAVGGFQQTSSDGSLTIDALFPEYKDLHTGAPELITNDQGWISVVLAKVHKSPISRIRTGQVDIRNIDALRAKGYKKGDPKAVTGNFKLVRRTTDPQTIYVKNALHKDDITDITDFDYVSYLYKIDRMMLNEELATAIVFGDGRDDGDEYKISGEHIRPIWLDDDLYTKHVDIDYDTIKAELQGTEAGANFGTNFIHAEALVNTLLHAREDFKGTGTPDMLIDPSELNTMLLARDRNGRRIYSSKTELASVLNVGNIYTAEQMKGKTRETKDGKTKKILCLVGNFADYSLGSTKGGEVSHFTQFDIDFNQQKSLLETRVSGATTKVYSFIAVEETVESAAG